MRKVVFRLLLTVFAITLLPHTGLALGWVDPRFDDALLEVSSDTLLPVVITFLRPVDSEQLKKDIAEMTISQRRFHVIRALKENLEDRGGEVISFLESEIKEERVSHLARMWILNGVSCRMAPELLDELLTFPQISWIVYDAPIAFEDANDEAEDELDDELDEISWGVSRIGATNLWDIGLRGRGGITGLIDTGVYLNHADLAGNIWVNEGEIPENGIDDDNNGFIDDINGWNFYDEDGDVLDVEGHGTKSAGVLAGQGALGDETGIAPESKIMVLRNWANNWSSMSTHPEAVQYAIDNGADAISCSMSYTYSGNVNYPDFVLLRTTMANALLAGMIQANSTGNNGVGDEPWNVNAPANCPPPWLHPDQTLIGGTTSIMACGAISSADNVQTYSDRGPSEWYRQDYAEEFRDYPWENEEFLGLIKPDIVAPSSVRTLSSGGGYSSYTGTSSSTPHLGGSLTLLRSIHPQASPEDICESLMMSAEDMGDEGFDNVSGSGILRVDLAHDYLENMFTYGSVFISIVNEEGEVVDSADVVVGDFEFSVEVDTGAVMIPRVLPGTYALQVLTADYAPLLFEEIEIVAGDTTNLEAVVLPPSINVMPLLVEEAIGPSDSLIVNFTIDNQMGYNVTLLVDLVPRDTSDWEIDHSFFPLIAPDFEQSAIVTVDSQFFVAGFENDLPIMFDIGLDGVVLDTIAIPAHFAESGYSDLDRLNDSLIVSPLGNNIFLLDQSWAIVDSIETAVETIVSLAHVDYLRQYYVSDDESNMLFILDSTGVTLDEIDLGHHPTGLVFMPNDGLGSAIYYLNNQLPGQSFLMRLGLHDRAVQILNTFNLADEGQDPSIAIDPFSYRPFQRVVFWENDAVVLFYNRWIRPDLFSVLDTVEVIPGTQELDLTVRAWMALPGETYEFDLVMRELDSDWENSTPITLDIIEYSVQEDETAELPNETELLPAYPNPFNSRAQISYTLKEEMEIQLAVYNVLGQQVALVDEGRRSAGLHQMVFDAESMATGLYFIVLHTAEANHAEKLLLVR